MSGYRRTRSGRQGYCLKIENFKAMINRVKKAFPHASVYATTLRQVIDTNNHLWGAIMLEGENWHVAEPREIHVLTGSAAAMDL